jgi:nitrate reductase NapD
VNVSGILVVVPVSAIASTIEALGSLPGVDVHHTDAATGRIVVTQEAETVAAEVEGLKRIKALPSVILAEMVYHHFEDDEEIGRAASLDAAEQARMLSFLNEQDSS